MKPGPGSVYLTPQQLRQAVCNTLKISWSMSAVYRALDSGKIYSVPIGGRILIPESEARQIINSLRTEATPEPPKRSPQQSPPPAIN